VSWKVKLAIGLAVWLVPTALLLVLVPSAGRNDEFKPQEEFRLDPWIPIHVGPLDLSINKGVVYLLVACLLTTVAMVWIARRMERKPNRVQTAVEFLYSQMRDNIAGGNMDARTASKWFTFIGTLFLFIWISNLIGYLPLPTNTHEAVDVAGVRVPALALYAATANLSIPLVLSAVVWISYNVEGVRNKGVVGYLKALVPEGVPAALRPFIFVLECFSQLMRLVSLSVRLFANLLAGHLIILFMSGALAVILGTAAIGWFALPFGIAIFVFEVGLVATLQAFIFATLTAIYLGEATAAHH
jgi:F-type H+-transporting ATPase subunit a